MTKKREIWVIHPGIQHSYHLANGLQLSGLFLKVRLFSWLIFKKRPLGIKYFDKRIKQIDDKIIISIFPLFEFLFLILNIIKNKVTRKRTHNLRYLFQISFNIYLLPKIYFSRKEIMIVGYETASWPMAYYCKTWDIPFILDLPSISHEMGFKLGIPETRLGIYIKKNERDKADFTIFCSNFAKNSYSKYIKSSNQFVLYVGAYLNPKKEIHNTDFNNPVLQIAFVGNTIKRKGLDIALSACAVLKIPYLFHIYGNIDEGWIINYLKTENIAVNYKIHGTFSQGDLVNQMLNDQILIHFLPSRFDAFGMVVLETMSLGITNFLSNRVGASEIISHSKDGFVIDKYQAAEFTTIIEKYFLLSENDKIKLKDNAIDTSKSYQWANYYHGVENSFKIILNLNARCCNYSSYSIPSCFMESNDTCRD